MPSSTSKKTSLPLEPPLEELKHATLGMSFLLTCSISQHRDAQMYPVEATPVLPHLVGYLQTQREVYVPISRSSSPTPQADTSHTHDHNVSHNALYMYSV